MALCSCGDGGFFDMTPRASIVMALYSCGDGGFLDVTPQAFDNNYFQLVAKEKFETKDVCCGAKIKGNCHKFGVPVNLAGEAIKGGSCGTDWCQANERGKTHLKSTKMWARVDASFTKHAERHGTIKRLIRLGGDWALLGEDGTKAIVTEFAKDEKAFFKQFQQSFAKVTRLGSEPADLKPCSAEKCARGRCGSIEFASCSPSMPAKLEACSLVGGSGGDGILKCGGKTLVCKVKSVKGS